MLARLLEAPHRDIHALELERGPGAGDEECAPATDAGAMLDPQAIAAYRARVRQLDEALDEALDTRDDDARARLEAERDSIARELSRAVGLGGRSRRVASDAERARVNVQRRLSDAVRRIAVINTEIAKHLKESIVTGVYCSYAPERSRR
jgi:hypothetical protein